MDPITLRLEAETVEELDDEYEERGFRNRTLYLRHLVDNRDLVFEVEDQQQGQEAGFETSERVAEHGEQLSDHADRLDDLDERVADLEEQARPFSWTSRNSESSP